MECQLHIGNIVDKESRQHLSKLIQDVLDSGFKNHTSDTVMVAALDVCKGAYAVNATVTNSMFTNNGRREKD